MVPVTIALMHEPVVVPRSTSPPRPGRPAGPVAHTVHRPPHECGRAPKCPVMAAQRGRCAHCQDRRETCRLIWSASVDLKRVPCSSVDLLMLRYYERLTESGFVVRRYYVGRLSTDGTSADVARVAGVSAMCAARGVRVVSPPGEMVNGGTRAARAGRSDRSSSRVGEVTPVRPSTSDRRRRTHCSNSDVDEGT